MEYHQSLGTPHAGLNRIGVDAVGDSLIIAKSNISKSYGGISEHDIWLSICDISGQKPVMSVLIIS